MRLGWNERAAARPSRIAVASAFIPLLLAAAASTPLKVDPFAEPRRPPLEAPEDAVAPEIVEPRTELRTQPTPGVVLQESLAEGAADRLARSSRSARRGELPRACPSSRSSARSSANVWAYPSSSPRAWPKHGDGDACPTEPPGPRRLFRLARNVPGEYGVTLRASR